MALFEPFWDKVSLLLPLTTDFNDVGLNAYTPSSNSATIDTGVYKYSTGSGYYSGSTKTEFANVSALDLGQVDFTIECDIRFAALPTSGSPTVAIFSKNTSDTAAGYGYTFRVVYNAGNYDIQFKFSRDGSAVVTKTYASVSLATNTWYHFLLEGSNPNIFFAKNGTFGTWTEFVDTDYVNCVSRSTTFVIGAEKSSGSTYTNYFNGWINNFRFSAGKGVVRYFKNFTQPSEPYPTGFSYLVNAPQCAMWESTEVYVRADGSSYQAKDWSPNAYSISENYNDVNSTSNLLCDEAYTIHLLSDNLVSAYLSLTLRQSVSSLSYMCSSWLYINENITGWKIFTFGTSVELVFEAKAGSPARVVSALAMDYGAGKTAYSVVNPPHKTHNYIVMEKDVSGGTQKAYVNGHIAAEGNEAPSVESTTFTLVSAFPDSTSPYDDYSDLYITDIRMVYGVQYGGEGFECDCITIAEPCVPVTVLSRFSPTINCTRDPYRSQGV
jgi:hypothetical protein